MDIKEVNAAMERKIDADLELLASLLEIARAHDNLKAKAAFLECIMPCLSPKGIGEFMKAARPGKPMPFDRW